MPFDIVLDPSAAKEYQKIFRSNRVIGIAIRQSIEKLATSPFEGKPLAGNKKGCFSLRKGDYRVIYEVHLPHTIHIIQIGHRKDVYR